MRRGKDSDLETLIDDDALETMIIDKLDSDPAFWENRKNRKTMITVEVDGGYAILNGIVKSQVERRKADILARALGALGVDNRLRLESENPGRPFLTACRRIHGHAGNSWVSPLPASSPDPSLRSQPSTRT